MTTIATTCTGNVVRHSSPLTSRYSISNENKYYNRIGTHLRHITYAVPKPPIHETQGRTARAAFDPNPDSGGALIGQVVVTNRHGYDVLVDPQLNKGTGFTYDERERLGIRGLVPPKSFGNAKTSLEEGVKRVLDRYNEFNSDLRKYVYLMNLQDRNEILFYRILIDHLAEMAPIIYTPTVGQACSRFGTLFRRPRGMYFSAQDKDTMHSMIFNWISVDVEIVVVTDGSRILGLGDLGANGMGIPIGKLSLYTAAAGIHPSKTLPCLIDVGTDNLALLEDQHGYLGLPQRRMRGEAYYEIVDEFVNAVRERYPRVLIQFEDFSNENALRLLNKYRNEILCFNDDIQGTGCVALAGLLIAMRATGSKTPEYTLAQQRILIAGAGSAGIGVANMIKEGMLHANMSNEEALKHFVLTDFKGLLGRNRKDATDEQIPFIRQDFDDQLSIEEAVAAFQPTIIIGLTGKGGLFTEKAIRTMSSYCSRPIIFPLSNPTDNAECTAKQAYEWTHGTAIVASGSPFQPVEYKGRTLYPGQSNNMYIFPGLGLGAIAIQAERITDSMLYAASNALASFVSDDWIASGRIFPQVEDLRHIALHVAVAVAKAGIAEHVQQVEVPTSEPELAKLITRRMWNPQYPQIARVERL